MIDDKGRLFGKISIIDIFIILVIISVVLVAYFKFGNKSYSGVREKEQLVHMKFFTPEVEDFTLIVEEGDNVVNETNGSNLGKVVEVNIGDSLVISPDSEGKLIPSAKEGYSSMEITSEVMGRITEGSVVVDGNIYSSGSEIVIRAGDAKIFLKISDIEAVK